MAARRHYGARPAPYSVGTGNASGGTTINGVNVNVDRKLFDELLTPRVLYLWRGQ